MSSGVEVRLAFDPVSNGLRLQRNDGYKNSSRRSVETDTEC